MAPRATRAPQGLGGGSPSGDSSGPPPHSIPCKTSRVRCESLNLWTLGPQENGRIGRGHGGGGLLGMSAPRPAGKELEGFRWTVLAAAYGQIMRRKHKGPFVEVTV